VDTVKFLIKLSVTAGALYWVFGKIEKDALLNIIKEANWPYLFLGFALFFLSKIIESVRLNIFFKAKQLAISQWSNFKLYLLGMFYNLFLPGGIGGDTYKVYWLNKNYPAIGLKALIGTLIMNRVNGMMALCALVVVSALFISNRLDYAWLLIAGIPVAYLIYYFVLARYFKDFQSSVLSTSMLSITIQGAQVISAHFILIALGVDNNYADYWFIYLVSGIAFIIPVTVGGVGSREVVFLYGSQLLLIDLNIAIALSLVIYCMRALVSVLGVRYLWAPHKLKENH